MNIQDRVESLRSKGVNMSWYGKISKEASFDKGLECGYFTIYLIEGDVVFTVDHQGARCLEFKKLKKPVEVACWYCSGCKVKYLGWEEAKEHREIKREVI